MKSVLNTFKLSLVRILVRTLARIFGKDLGKGFSKDFGKDSGKDFSKGNYSLFPKTIIHSRLTGLTK